jgi:hypothetical protein
MATTYEYLLRRKADLEVRMVEAQKRAMAPFEGELRAIELAIGAIERAGLGEGKVAGETPSFAGVATPSRRGRRSRTTGDMILMALDVSEGGMGVADIAQQLERRWNRSVPTSAVMLELQNLEAEGAAVRVAAGWARGTVPVDLGSSTIEDDNDDIAHVA